LDADVSGKKAIAFVRKKRPGSIHNKKQEDFVFDYVNYLEQKKSNS
jgi:hypothetical protein